MEKESKRGLFAKKQFEEFFYILLLLSFFFFFDSLLLLLLIFAHATCKREQRKEKKTPPRNLIIPTTITLPSSSSSLFFLGSFSRDPAPTPSIAARAPPRKGNRRELAVAAARERTARKVRGHSEKIESPENKVKELKLEMEF